MKLPQGFERQIERIADDPKIGRSYFLYDLTPMKRKISELRHMLPRSVGIFYAMKANPHPSFLAAALDSNVDGVEIASLGEGRKAIAAGFSPAQLVFTGPGKSPEELAWAVEVGIRLIHIESLTEAHRLNAICTARNVTQDILVRVNPNFHVHGAQANFSGDSSKFGIDEAMFEEILPKILDLSKLRFRGLHVYSASGVLKATDLLENCRRVFKLASRIEGRYDALRCEVIDFGGGFGIDYTETEVEFAPTEYVEGLRELIDTYGFEQRRFVLELGRYLTADSGWYCTEILDIKSSLGRKQIVCQGGSHHFRRPVALEINHPVTVVRMNVPPLYRGQETVDDEMAFLGGSLCNSADKLSTTPVAISKADVGDVLVVGLAGAYGFSMSHLEFLSHDRPAEIVVDAWEPAAELSDCNTHGRAA